MSKSIGIGQLDGTPFLTKDGEVITLHVAQLDGATNLLSDTIAQKIASGEIGAPEASRESVRLSLTMQKQGGREEMVDTWVSTEWSNEEWQAAPAAEREQAWFSRSKQVLPDGRTVSFQVASPAEMYTADAIEEETIRFKNDNKEYAEKHPNLKIVPSEQLVLQAVITSPSGEQVLLPPVPKWTVVEPNASEK